MYFVTTKQAGYVLFSMTPSERAAVGVTETQRVHLLFRQPDGGWAVRREWDVAQFSHTQLMTALHHRDEPSDPEQLLDLLPPHLR
jgi:hypothetical protein